jgi:hypothetical protein
MPIVIVNVKFESKTIPYVIVFPINAASYASVVICRFHIEGKVTLMG